MCVEAEVVCNWWGSWSKRAPPTFNPLTSVPSRRGYVRWLPPLQILSGFRTRVGKFKGMQWHSDPFHPFRPILSHLLPRHSVPFCHFIPFSSARLGSKPLRPTPLLYPRRVLSTRPHSSPVRFIPFHFIPISRSNPAHSIPFSERLHFLNSSAQCTFLVLLVSH